MIRFLSIGILFFLIPSYVFADGLITNGVHSPQYTRMLSRNASTEIDAVFYNPAGLVNLDYGWHYGFGNTSYAGERSIHSDFPLLQRPDYQGNNQNFLSPVGYVAYRTDKWIISAGFSQMIAEGNTNYSRGIPSYEIGISKLKLNNLLGIEDYKVKIDFSSKHIYWGFQAGATFEMSDAFSVFGGLRVVTGSNRYSGQVRNIEVKYAGNYYSGSVFMNNRLDELNDKIGSVNPVIESLEREMSEFGTSAMTLDLLLQGGIYSQEKADALIDGLRANGISTASTGWTVQRVWNEYRGVITRADAVKREINNNSSRFNNKNIDVNRSATGLTPILGVCLIPSEEMVLSLKYEYRTRLNLNVSSYSDDTGLFNEDESSRIDIPPSLAIGIGYTPLYWLDLSLSYNTYFDKEASWGWNLREKIQKRLVSRNIDLNTWELALGIQFNLSNRFAFSMGGMITNPGVADTYQSDFSYSNPSMTAAFGFQWKITELLALDAGFMNVFYKDAKVSFKDPDIAFNNGMYQEVFGKTTMGFGIGLSYCIFK
jgi:long-subunit fatty acid transport protein